MAGIVSRIWNYKVRNDGGIAERSKRTYGYSDSIEANGTEIGVGSQLLNYQISQSLNSHA
jgi:hypothetical protein